MKQEKAKHNHKATKIIKISCYAILLFLPIISLVSTILFNSFNPNSVGTQEIEYNYKYETNEVAAKTDLIDGNIYHFKWQVPTSQGFTYLMPIKEVIGINNQIFKITNKSKTYLAQLYITGNVGILARVKQTEQSEPIYVEITTYENSLLEFDFIYDNNNSAVAWSTDLIQYISESDYNIIESATLKEIDNTNIVEYSTKQITENGILSTINNDTLIYTPIKLMFNSFGIYNNFIIKITAYWLLISAIYIIFDIIIESFVFITHLIKPREL